MLFLAFSLKNEKGTRKKMYLRPNYLNPIEEYGKI